MSDENGERITGTSVLREYYPVDPNRQQWITLVGDGPCTPSFGIGGAYAIIAFRDGATFASEQERDELLAELAKRITADLAARMPIAQPWHPSDREIL